MAKDSSFDIVSDFDVQEMTNALDQTKREILSRYDFKGTNSSIDFGEKKEEIILFADSDYKLDALKEILQSKMVKRNLSLKILDESNPKEQASGGMVRQKIKFQRGLDSEKAKKITKIIRENYPKIKTQIQGEAVRVVSPKRDELQEVISLLKGSDFDFPIQFENYR